MPLTSRFVAVRIASALPHLAVWAVIGCLSAIAIGTGGFWWTDETRHAMGGVFILDLVRDMPFADPTGYAMRYFAQYPALALNWYLPGFYAVEAVFYALFGISEASAHWTVVAFSLLAASAWFAWAKGGWSAAVALGATALFVSAPAWNFWTRSVMLEVPTIAMFIVAVWSCERYLDRPTLSRALLAGIAIAAALLFKQIVALLLPALLVYGLWSPRRSALWSSRATPIYLLTIVAMAIVAAHAIKFGGQGLSGIVGEGRTELGISAPRFSMERWLLHPSALVHTWGWPLLALSAVGAVLPSRGDEPRLPLLYAWLACWYATMSLLFGAPGDAPRYALYVFPVLAVFAARPLFVLRSHNAARAVALALLLVAILVNIYRSAGLPAPYVNGYREAAEFVHQLRPKGPILFAGKHDGSLIFHLRRLDDPRREVVLRADKMLVSIAVNKIYGMKSHVSSVGEIRELVEHYGVELIVIERPDIMGIKEFAMLRELVQQPEFERIRIQPVSRGNGAEGPERLEIYRFLEHRVVEDATIIIPLPHMGREIRFKRNESRWPQ